MPLASCQCTRRQIRLVSSACHDCPFRAGEPRMSTERFAALSQSCQLQIREDVVGEGWAEELFLAGEDREVVAMEQPRLRAQ
eukprot:1302310-Rhodomonas_salina.3